MHSIKKLHLCVLAVLVSTSVGQDAFVPQNGYLNLNSGEVEIESASGVKRKVVRELESQKQDLVVLKPGDSVRTDAQTNCSISFPPYGIAQLEPNTKAKLPAASTTSSLELLRGKLFLDVNGKNLAPSKQQFRLKMPAMILAVKGTRFFAESVDEVETSGVHSGEVQVFRSGGGRSLSLQQGKAISVTKGKFSPTRPLTNAEKSLKDHYSGFAVTYESAEREKRSFRKRTRMDVEEGIEIDGSRSLVLRMEEKDATFVLNLASIMGKPDFAYFKIRAKNIGYLNFRGSLKTIGREEAWMDGVYRLIEMGHDSKQWMDIRLPIKTTGGTEYEKAQIVFTMVSEPGGSWFEVSPVFVGYKEK